MFTEPHHASAAKGVYDDWRYQEFFLIHHNADYRIELAVGNLKHGDTFDVTTQVSGTDKGIIKLYRVDYSDSDYGDLQRYKTIQPSDTGNPNYSKFTTPITNVYEPGSYVAVLKVGEDYYYGGKFTISR
ncbi:DUF5065 family protein [Bacillus clarus]|uniref:DUF5065 family protein n=1 Tax=Bacillus clarus TaxID=2338372 RepID=A0ABX9KM43_9BACI|nr:DUF5065 family protein [Bacillus clarus]